MIIKSEFTWGDTVYLKTDPEQLPRIITAITAFSPLAIQYELACGTEITPHWAIEISKDENLNIRLALN